MMDSEDSFVLMDHTHGHFAAEDVFAVPVTLATLLVQ
jgi:hypothetical protein